ncbi:MAG: hypothetical protein ACOZAL_01815 [Patescibacteria group bacterium]
MKIFEILMLVVGVFIIITAGSICKGWIEEIIVVTVGVFIGIVIPEFVKRKWRRR